MYHPRETLPTLGGRSTNVRVDMPRNTERQMSPTLDAVAVDVWYKMARFSSIIASLSGPMNDCQDACVDNNIIKSIGLGGNALLEIAKKGHLFWNTRNLTLMRTSNGLG